MTMKMRQRIYLTVFLTLVAAPLSAAPASAIKAKYPKAPAAIPLLIEFPVLAKLLGNDDSWTLHPARLKEQLFPESLTLDQGSENYPLIYAGRRPVAATGQQDLKVWDQFAYEAEYRAFDPSRPVILFYIGRPLDVRCSRASHKELYADYPPIARIAPAGLHTKIKALVKALEPYGARDLGLKHQHIDEYLLPGGTLLEYADFSFSYGNRTPYVRITLRPADTVSKRRLPAFPGAEGAGMYSVGGRGGKVYVVTTLKDYMPKGRPGQKRRLGQGTDLASLKNGKDQWIPMRKNLKAGMPYPLPKPENDYGPIIENRGMIIKTATPTLPPEPVIRGSLREAIEAKGPRIILFGVTGTIKLTSPLAIRNPYVTLIGHTAPGQGIQIRNWSLSAYTHDVIIRYMRIRVGDIKGPNGMSRIVGDQTQACELRAMNIIADHCDFAYANDQIFNVRGHYNQPAITLQWSYIYGGLSQSTHEKGSHSMTYGMSGWGEVSMHHNLTAHSAARNPRVWGLNLDWRNNILYDYSGSGYGNKAMLVAFNYVGNTQKRGKSKAAFVLTGSFGRLYAHDNQLPAGSAPFTAASEAILEVPYRSTPVRTEPRAEAYEKVINLGGADLPARDVITTWIAESVRKNTGRIPRTTKDFPHDGFASYRPARPPADTDRDGMPDAWERKCRLNPNDASDSAGDKDRDGYTNVEEYINDTDPTKFVDYIKPENNIHSLHRTDIIHRRK